MKLNKFYFLTENVYFSVLYNILIGDRRGVYRVLVGKSEGKGPLGRPRRRWEDIIKMDFQEVGCWSWNVSSWIRIGAGAGEFGNVLWVPF